MNMRRDERVQTDKGLCDVSTMGWPFEHRTEKVIYGFSRFIDKRNFHLFQPLLYQVATGALSPANIAAPLRAVLARQRNVPVLMGEVVDIDVGRRRVRFKDDGEADYNTLPRDRVTTISATRRAQCGPRSEDRQRRHRDPPEDLPVI
jgi:hypothetical protein